MKIFYTYYRTLIWVVIMCYLLFSPSSGFPKTGFINIPNFDKIVHFGMFGIFTALFLFESEQNKRTKLNTLFWLLLISLCFGITSEFIQYAFIKGRNGTTYDLLADMTGVILGIACYYTFGKNIMHLIFLTNKKGR